MSLVLGSGWKPRANRHVAWVQMSDCWECARCKFLPNRRLRCRRWRRRCCASGPRCEAQGFVHAVCLNLLADSRSLGLDRSFPRYRRVAVWQNQRETGSVSARRPSRACHCGVVWTSGGRRVLRIWVSLSGRWMQMRRWSACERDVGRQGLAKRRHLYREVPSWRRTRNCDDRWRRRRKGVGDVAERCAGAPGADAAARTCEP